MRFLFYSHDGSSNGRSAPRTVTIGTVGLGVVGGVVRRHLARAGFQTYGYDRYQGVGSASDLGACEIIFVCVPTPATADDGFDLSEVFSAVEEIHERLRPGAIVAIKSTVTPGTCDELQRRYPHLEFASVPEFLTASDPDGMFSRPDRVVIGARKATTASQLAAILGAAAPGAPTVILRPIEAELVKLCANAMLAAKVTMANELAEVCARFSADWSRVQPAIGLDHRIGPDHLMVTAERGFGGACLPKDLDGLLAAVKKVNYSAPVLERIAEFNRWIRSLAATPHESPTWLDPARDEGSSASSIEVGKTTHI